MVEMAKFDISNEIQHQIDDQIRMREGAMKLMSACSTLNQALETSKNLLTINARILGLMSALQRKKKQHVLKEYNRQRSSVCMESSEDCCPGRIAMSDIRVPLMWKDNVHFSGKTGDQSYYAFALIRCGDQVRDTSLYEITSADTDMYFAETLIFEDLLPDIKMDFEVYYTVITSSEAHPILKTPRASITMRSSSRRQAHFSAPKFCLAGHVQLCIDDIRMGMISKDLTMGGKGASGVAVLGDNTEFPIHPLELWGQICCEMAAQPKCMLEKSACGYCQIKVNDSWCKYYAEVYQCNINSWKDKAQAGKTTPDHFIKLEQDMKVCTDDTRGGSCILQLISNNEILHTLQFLNDEDFIKWKFVLRIQIHNLLQWKIACKELMYIEEHQKCRRSIPSTASFYEQIDIGDEPLGSTHKSISNGTTKVSVPSLSDLKETTELPDATTQHENVFNNISMNSSSSLPSDPLTHLRSEQDTILPMQKTPTKIPMKDEEITPNSLVNTVTSPTTATTTNDSKEMNDNHNKEECTSSSEDVFSEESQNHYGITIPTCDESPLTNVTLQETSDEKKSVENNESHALDIDTMDSPTTNIEVDLPSAQTGSNSTINDIPPVEMKAVELDVGKISGPTPDNNVNSEKTNKIQEDNNLDLEKADELEQNTNHELENNNQTELTSNLVSDIVTEPGENTKLCAEKNDEPVQNIKQDSGQNAGIIGGNIVHIESSNTCEELSIASDDVTENESDDKIKENGHHVFSDGDVIKGEECCPNIEVELVGDMVGSEISKEMKSGTTVEVSIEDCVVSTKELHDEHSSSNHNEVSMGALTESNIQQTEPENTSEQTKVENLIEGSNEPCEPAQQLDKSIDIPVNVDNGELATPTISGKDGIMLDNDALSHTKDPISNSEHISDHDIVSSSGISNIPADVCKNNIGLKNGDINSNETDAVTDDKIENNSDEEKTTLKTVVQTNIEKEKENMEMENKETICSKVLDS